MLDDASLAIGLALPPWLDIVLIGTTTGWLGQSLWLREIAGREDGAPRSFEELSDGNAEGVCQFYERGQPEILLPPLDGSRERPGQSATVR